MTERIKIGDRIPPFKVKDTEGEFVTDEDLIGSPFLIYFYPKDGTPGCTKEACSFRDSMESFDDLDILVVGVSPDSIESHKKFMAENDLNFPLLSDENLEVAKAFGVDKGASVQRASFLCDEDGIVQWIENPVNVDGHTDRILQAIEDALA